MRFIFHGRHMEVTEALQTYAERKIRRAATIAPCEEAVVTFSVNRHKQHTHRVEVLLRLDGAVLRAEEDTGDMYEALDAVADKLERRLRKLKEKLRRRGRRGAEAGPEPMEAVRLDDEEAFAIARVKRVQLKPMDIEEAILELNLLDHSFHVFVNGATQATEVVYRRHDGTYGLITS
ncbi:ribosome-associated translation inhibitor RaiA [Paenibacillus athensensis]|uniref:Ribosome hibernation promoting factor n=1 Tax=Paenibacillus athensensis TaxID=1967502 RepID=A0A4Y8PSS2_9BACL|nr:ribosome-associated translation inhibitor RaiA [Paenibacillus athensensis]MCD1258594.1 ribosome-associated translation inhibitor RaiA [Paenibacillus athensensis]